MKPAKKEKIARVVGSAALRMRDDNYLSLPRSIADEGNPIVLNNACCSWHQLAKTFAFNGARAYMGTLFPVLGSEAEAITVALLGQRFGELLPEALWAAQRDAFGPSIRKPYLLMGVYPQVMNVVQRDVPKYLANRLARAGMALSTQLKRTADLDERTERWWQQRIGYYRRELNSLQRNWLE